MLRVRTALAAGMVVVGALLIVRMLSYGLNAGIAPGIILGALIMGLGLYRLRLISAARSGGAR